jgi:hypothetical protein
MGIDVKKPIFNLEPNYMVTMLTREEWARGHVTPPAVKAFVWFTDGSKTIEGNGAGIHGQSVGRRFSISLENLLQSFRLMYTRYLSAFKKPKLRIR